MCFFVFFLPFYNRDWSVIFALSFSASKVEKHILQGSVCREESINSILQKKSSSAACMISYNPVVQWLVERMTDKLKEAI